MPREIPGKDKEMKTMSEYLLESAKVAAFGIAVAERMQHQQEAFERAIHQQNGLETYVVGLRLAETSPLNAPVDLVIR